jgi:hypothetical protein
MRGLFGLILIFSFCIPVILSGQVQLWSVSDEASLRTQDDQRVIKPLRYRVYSFDMDQFRSFLDLKSRGNTEMPDIQIPLPDGTFRIYSLVETPVFEEGLYEKYPGYFSYTGYEQDGSSVLKLSLSPFNVNAMITGNGMQPVFIDPYTPYNETTYIVYHKSSLAPRKGGFSCGVANDDRLELSEEEKASFRTLAAGDCQLRSYRLALACTGEYAAFHGGSKEKVLAAYNTTMTRVNGIYERDVAITMKLIKDTDKLIFLDPATDPYTNNSGSAMLNQNQTTIDNIIGLQNYDIGHVFSTGGGGIANLRAPCSNNRAKGVTGQAAPVGDPFDVDYVAHEMGHQFGANHTQNNSCQRNGSTAVEPGSASTIMGYAGICEPNVQSNSDAHFHAVSISEITSFAVNGNGNGCAVRIGIDNRPPSVNIASSSYVVPVSTAFLLQADATDPDGDVLSYCWEQTNSQVATMPPVAGNTAGPAFRSLPPTESPVRYFPDLERRYPQWEVLPSVARTMNFRCTVRDNYYYGGCTDEMNTEVTFTDQAGPFTVTYPNTPAVSWLVGSTQTVTWNVAKTDLAPVNCSKVDIYLSTDGGKSYPVLIARDVPNTGSADIVTPGLPTNQARIMVKASENIFFDVSNANFKIISSFDITPANTSFAVCNEDSLTVALYLSKNLEFSDPLQLQVSDLLQAVSAFFEKDIVSAFPDTVVLHIEGLQGLETGHHLVEINAIAGGETLKVTLSLFKASVNQDVVQKLFPTANLSGVDAYKVPFRWTSVQGITGYRFQLSTRPDFGNLLQDVVVEDTFRVATLAEGSIYFWRIQAISPCQENPFTEIASFRTSGGSGKPAVLLHNEVLLLDKGEVAAIDDTKLKIETINSGFAYFTVVKKPQHGVILSGNDTLVVGSTFTMKQIEQGDILYVHGDNEADRDSLFFDVLDDQNRWLPGNVFTMRIRQAQLGVVAFRTAGLSCFGDQAAVVTAEGFGGIAPYTFSLDGLAFQDSVRFENLNAGSYRIFIKDASGELDSSNMVEITEPARINLSLKQAKYDIIAEANGGTGTLQFAFQNNVFDSGNVFKDPGNGFYTVMVRDENGCVETDTITVFIPALQLETTVNSQILCAGQKAAVGLKAAGGIPPYLYSLNGAAFSASQSLNLSAGVYAITAKDSGDKTIMSDSITITQPAPIVVTVTQNRFQVILNATGGTGNLTFSPNGIDYSEQDTFNFTDNGTYRLYVRDENNCLRTINVNLNVLKDVTANVKTPTCYGRNNGSIALFPENGTGPFAYRLNNGAFGSVNMWSGLEAGAYTYAIADSKRDTIQGSITLSEPDSLQVQIEINGLNIAITATGGTAGYVYSVDGGLVFLDNSEFLDLEPGGYNVVVRDKNGCLASQEIVIVSTDNTLVDAGIRISPNPATDQLIISWPADYPEKGLVSLRIFNAAGQLWHQVVTDPSLQPSFFIPVDSWPAGVYTIQLLGKKQNSLQKVVKM